MKRLLAVALVLALGASIASAQAITAYWNGAGEWVNWNGAKLVTGWTDTSGGGGTDLNNHVVSAADTYIVQADCTAINNLGGIAPVLVNIESGSIKANKGGSGLENDFSVTGGGFASGGGYARMVVGDIDLSGAGMTLTGASWASPLQYRGDISGTGGISVPGGSHLFMGANYGVPTASSFTGGISVGFGASLGCSDQNNPGDWAGADGEVHLAAGADFHSAVNGTWTNKLVDFYGGNGTTDLTTGQYGGVGPHSGGNKEMRTWGRVISAGPEGGGDGSGVLSVWGAVNMYTSNGGSNTGSDGTLAVTIGDGQADKIVATSTSGVLGDGTFSIAGWTAPDCTELVLNFTSDWSGTSYTIVERGGGFGGAFTNDTAGEVTGVDAASGDTWTADVNYNGNGDIVLSNIVLSGAPHPGDANDDGAVDVSDLGILSGNYGQPGDMDWADADFNDDDTVDVSDLGILSGEYGWTASAGVPEPMTLSFLAVGALALIRRKK